MATAREELHALIDRLSDDKVITLLEQARAEVEQPRSETLSWLEQVRQLRAELSAKYGRREVSVVELLNEAREERLNDILGGL
ncbi:MAG: hypothetical protein HZC41_22825 [Chloroflexi bacterium]|nr:hypothetical protein [Chloroflexota bacterium]